jgi:dTDP-6-deoxy-L-talose 4-dehydrogenase (NAD+)
MNKKVLLSTQEKKSSVSSSNTVIVTGATGFIGQHLVPLFLQNKYNVIAIARDETKARTFKWFDEVKFVSLDINKLTNDLEIFPGMSLIHLVWGELSNYNSSIHLEDNLAHSYNFIKSLLQRGLSQVLVTGTCFEYGFQNGPISSKNITLPANPYAIAKDTLRKQLEFLLKENIFCLQWARLFYMYGKGQNQKSVLSQLDKAIDNGDTIFNMSGGEQLRDYLPVELVAKQLFDLFVSKKTGTYNVCSGIPISVRRLVEEQLKKRCANIKLNLGYYPYPNHEPMAFWGVRDIGETILTSTLPNTPSYTIYKK